MPRQKPMRSPLHPKALTLGELRKMQRGETVVICCYSMESQLERMDAVSFVGIVTLWTGNLQAYPGIYVAIRPAPKYLKRSMPYLELGGGLTGVDVDSHELRHLREFYVVKRGDVFGPRDLGLAPPNPKVTDKWPNYCVIRPEHM